MPSLSSKPVFETNGLGPCSLVFLRHETVRRPLQLVCDGSFRGEDSFTLFKGGKEDTISTDRLKPTAIGKYSPTQCRGSRRMLDTSQPVNSAYPSSVMRTLQFLKNSHSTKRKKWLIDCSISPTEHTTPSSPNMLITLF